MVRKLVEITSYNRILVFEESIKENEIEQWINSWVFSYDNVCRPLQGLSLILYDYENLQRSMACFKILSILSE